MDLNEIKSTCDFSGWATKNNLKCADGLIIRHNAFKTDDGRKVPLVWNHSHDDPSKVLGHAFLENRDDGVYAYAFFNDSAAGVDAKKAVMHGDVTNMSIWANNLDRVGNEIMHGVIREISLVLAGANPGAFIESVLAHGEVIDTDETEGLFYNADSIIFHADTTENIKTEEVKDMDEKKPEDKKETTTKSVKEVFDAMTDEQKAAVMAIASGLFAEAKKTSEEEAAKETPAKDKSDEETKKEIKHGLEENNDMKYNMFEGGNDPSKVISHSDMEKIFGDAQRLGSLRDAVNENIASGVLAHSINTTGMTTATGTANYGMNDASMLFPGDKNLVGGAPEWISRNMDWVKKVMSSVHHTPFSRIKSVYANITEDEARAKGYLKSKEKKTEVFTTLKRSTTPQTVYKFQKMDRDDVLDITDFDVVAWIKAEMRVMLDEEIARAILIGDGRAADADDKIQPDHIRPIATDVPLFNVMKKVTPLTSTATESDVAKLTISEAIRARKNYKGSGNPTFFTTEDVLTEMLLLEDTVGHRLYKTEQELATALRVSAIVTVESMENVTVKMNNDTTDTGSYPLLGIIVNLADYNVGADKGGEVSLFDDFDIKYNQHEYLIETRISGALTKPFSAITLVRGPNPTAKPE